MSGVNIVLGDDRSVNRTFIQAEGAALRLKARDLRLAMEKSPTLRLALLRYAQVFSVQVTQTAVANGRAKLESRLARWLLMAHDRFDHGPFPFTHQFLALMLGVPSKLSAADVDRIAEEAATRFLKAYAV